jgi:hypothetical protein
MQPRPRLPLALVFAAFALLGSASVTEARQGRVYRTRKRFGLGLMLGGPSGLAGKYFLDGGKTAVAFGVGAYYQFRHHHGTHVHADLLWHPALLAVTPSFTLPLYLGLGGRFLDSHGWRDDQYDEHSHLGVRAPLGLAMDFRRVPLDAFLEFALVLDLFVGHDDHPHSDFSGAIGVRYYF